MTKRATTPEVGDGLDDLAPGFADAFRHIGTAIEAALATGTAPGTVATALLVQGVSRLAEAHGHGHAAEILRRLADLTDAERWSALQ